MKYGILDPRNITEAQAVNDTLLGKKTLGIEVTNPMLAARCGLGNIDPQHTDGVDKAAIEVALTAELPPSDATLVTSRADLDSVGSMAIFIIRKDYEVVKQCDLMSGFPGAGIQGKLAFYPQEPFSKEDEAGIARVRSVAESDRFARGDWQGVRPLPAKKNPWPEADASAESSRPLAAIASAVSDFKIAIETRVNWMVDWLLFGDEPKGYREKVEKERVDMITALENDVIKATTAGYCVACNLSFGFGGNMNPNTCPQCFGCDVKSLPIAVVVSTHRAATMVGYSLAPIVVALNPGFRFQGGTEHTKFTICQYTGEYMDLKVALTELSEMENGWGGSPTIGGSPQGISSHLTIDQVVDVVQKYLK